VDSGAFIDAHGGCRFDRAMAVLVDIANGMAYVHSKRIAHGDLNPSNVRFFLIFALTPFQRSPSHPLVLAGAAAGGQGGGARLDCWEQGQLAPALPERGLCARLRALRGQNYGLWTQLPAWRAHVSAKCQPWCATGSHPRCANAVPSA